VSTTTVGIASGERVTLTLGRRYLVTFSDGIRGEVIIGGRRRNGDLLINHRGAEGPAGGAYVKARSIEHIQPVPDALAEVESDAGQATLEAAHKASVAARNGTRLSDAYDGAGEPRRVRPRLELDEAGEIRIPYVEPKKRPRSKVTIDVTPKIRVGPRPYSERNQVWKCGTCGKRTRAESCSGTLPNSLHDRVAAPAGKRRADRS
jgi:hypothetical protein